MNVRDKQQALQEFLLKLARLDTDVTEKNLEQYIFTLQDIYADDFRHLYSGMFGVITRIDADNDLDMAKLQGNIQILYESVVRWRDEGRGHVTPELCDKLEKLYDHVNLEISRISYTQEIAQRMEDKNRESGEEIKSLSEKAANMQKDYITILGIFSSIVITFVAGMVFSSSILNNIDKVSIYRLTFVIILIAMMLFNLLNLLLDFIAKVNMKPLAVAPKISDKKKEPQLSTIAGINLFLFFMMIVDLALWALYWYRATSFNTFTGY